MTQYFWKGTVPSEDAVKLEKFSEVQLSKMVKDEVKGTLIELPNHNRYSLRFIKASESQVHVTRG